MIIKRMTSSVKGARRFSAAPFYWPIEFTFVIEKGVSTLVNPRRTGVDLEANCSL
ncbi:MAG: hypothetical protein J6X44_00035 [Thermoguttaceae bacterium]|nr:hypothetical protein [Thermoguttaceae bacterium]